MSYWFSNVTSKSNFLLVFLNLEIIVPESHSEGRTPIVAICSKKSTWQNKQWISGLFVLDAEDEAAVIGSTGS